jgi:hypothetical protein
VFADARRGFASRRRRLASQAFPAVVAIGLALAAPGCLHGDDDDEPPPESRREPRLVDSTVVRGGSPRERALLQRAVDGMGLTTLRRIAIAPPEARRETDGETAVAIAFTPVRGVTVRRQWDEWIVAGAFSRRLLSNGLPAEVDASDDRAAFTARPTVEGQPDPRPLPSAREDAVVAQIRNAARRSGGRRVRVDVHRPYGVAVTISLTASNPAAYLKDELRPLLGRLDVNRRRLEGVYLAVRDRPRRLVLEWGSWTRNPAGSYWVRRDLANCSPIQQSEPPGAEPPPPCPE